MSTKAKLIFGDDINYSKSSNFVDYAEVKIKSTDSLKSGIMGTVLAYIYFFTAVMGIIFFLSK
ncbi:MAG: hypothetical protein R6W68_00230 [Ignavibacteriaceae bacterium]